MWCNLSRSKKKEKKKSLKVIEKSKSVLSSGFGGLK
jgi:hypothetical protein